MAAAVIGGAGAIVTHNLKDFPRARVPSVMDVQDPAVFAHNTVSVNPLATRRAIEKIAARSGRRGPIMDVDKILDVLDARYGFRDAVTVIRESA